MLPFDYMPPIDKNQHYELFVMNQGFRGDGITLLRSKTIYIPNALPSDRVEVKIVKICKTFCYGKLTRILLWSHQRRTAPCPIAAQCGGCSLQHQKYQYQLEFKQEHLNELFLNSSLCKSIPILPIKPSSSEFGYRNKLQVSIQEQKGEIVLGLFAARSNRIVPMPKCLLAGTKINQIFLKVKHFLNQSKPPVYDAQKKKDGLRHLVIRESYTTGETMIAWVLSKADKKVINDLQSFSLIFENVTSVLININSESGDAILGQYSQCVMGRPYLIDEIAGFKIRVTLNSFMQANMVEVENLYNKIVDWAQLSGKEWVLDAYCGSGALTMMLARHAKKVVGVELNSTGIEDAKFNVSLNKVENCEFECQKVEDWVASATVVPDLVVLDPPRQGCHEYVLDSLIRMKVKRIVYCSCNPHTFIKDAETLVSASYHCERVQSVDMFPQTLHVELLAIFELRSK